MDKTKILIAIVASTITKLNNITELIVKVSQHLCSKLNHKHGEKSLRAKVRKKECLT